MKHRRRHGLTLLELMIALVVVTLLATLALPSVRGSERARLKLAAETLASDLAEARFEAARRGSPLQVDVAAGPAWCWVVATQQACSCSGAPACQLKAEQAASYAGVQLVTGQGARFAPDGSTDGAGTALFQSSRGEQLRVNVSPLGRARVCSVGGSVSGYPVC